ncbi:MAG: hypothetical protein AAF471_08895 [Myxococcota bacterium]
MFPGCSRPLAIDLEQAIAAMRHGTTVNLKRSNCSEELSQRTRREAAACLSLYLRVDEVLLRFPVCVLFPKQVRALLELEEGPSGIGRLLRALRVLDGTPMSSGCCHMQVRLHRLQRGGYVLFARRVAGEPPSN